MKPRYVSLVENISIPHVALVKQTFTATEITEPEATLSELLADDDCVNSTIRPGMSIALTVGSRGLASLQPLVKTLVAEIRRRGAHPFIVPAMGSHGGATAEGQLNLLAHLGITETSVNCEIRSSMETVELGKLANGMSVRIDKNAYEADGIILFNRIKPHSAFRYINESGLAKMLSIGLGKQSGAENCHAWGFQHLGRFVVEMARIKLETCRVLFGVGTIENAYDKLAKLVVLQPDGLIEREREYLQEAMRNMPRLPLGPLEEPLATGPLDVLIVDETGKEFSGSGMDPNITGRPSSTAISGGPDVTRLVLLDVSEKSQGNAIGANIAHVSTERLARKFDREAVYANALTSGVLNAAGVPMVMPDDKTAIQAALKTCEAQNRDAIRMLRIPNTLHLEYLYASEAMLPELKNRPGIDILGEPAAMRFDSAGLLIDPWPGKPR